MKRVRSRFFPFVFAAFLLCAQFGALTHAIWHALGHAAGHANAAVAEQPSQAAAGDSHHDEAPSSQAAMCAFDLACGQVLGGVHASAAPLVVLAAVAQTPPDLPASRLHADTLTPKSRGPPVLL